jgi:type VI secretion system protein VasD
MGERTTMAARAAVSEPAHEPVFNATSAASARHVSNRRLALRLAMVAVPLGLAGCGMFGRKPPPAPPPPPPGAPPPAAPPAAAAPAGPPTAIGTVSAAADLNPSVSNRPSPLAIRVYELRSDTAFGKADFIALYQGEQAAIGADLVAKDELMLQPGESRNYGRTLNAQTKYVAVFAAYRNVERATWRAIAPVPPGRTLKLAIRAESQAVSVSLQP